MTTRNEDSHGRIKDGVDAARDKAAHAYEAARDKAGQAVHDARDRARRTAASLEGNPVGVLVGGLAVGALVGALVPRSQREKELLAPVGKRLGATAAAALAAAKEAGREELDGLGLTPTAAKGQARSLIDGVVKAAKTAGTAAAEAGRSEARAR